MCGTLVFCTSFLHRWRANGGGYKSRGSSCIRACSNYLFSTLVVFQFQSGLSNYRDKTRHLFSIQSRTSLRSYTRTLCSHHPPKKLGKHWPEGQNMQHPAFMRGPPPQYYLDPRELNFAVRMGSGDPPWCGRMCSAKFRCTYLYSIYIKRLACDVFHCPFHEQHRLPGAR